MSDPVGVGGGRFPPGHERANLVADLGRYLAAWEQRLRAPAAGSDLGGVRDWSADLQVRARDVGFGGVAHHLSRCLALIGAPGPLDTTSLRIVLKDLSELAWQAKQELPPAEQVTVDRILEEGRQAGGPRSSLEPPPMLTVHPALRRGQSPAQGPPPQAAAPPPPASPTGPGAIEPPRIVSPIPPAPPGVRAPPVGPNSSYDTSRASAPAPPKGVFESAPPAAAMAPPVAIPIATGGRAPSAENQPPSDRARPNLAVRTMFRLRAFGQAAAPRAPEPPPAAGGTPPPGGASPLLGLRGFSQPPPVPGAGLPGPGGPGLPGASRPLPPLGGAPGGLPPLGGPGAPGVGGGRGSSGPSDLPGFGGGARGVGGPGAGGPPLSPNQAMPRYLSNSLPPLPEAGEARIATPGDSRKSDPLGRAGSAKRESASRARRDSKSVKAIRRRDAPGSGIPWWLGVLGAICAGVLALVVVLSWNRLRTPADKLPRASGSGAGSAPTPPVGASGTGTVAAPSGPRLRTPSDEALEDLRVKAHGKGTKDSPELNAWVDHQAALQAKLLQTGKCEGSAAACQILYRPGEDTSATGRVTPRKPSSPRAVRSRWMAGLRMPSIPVEDDLRVQRIFERLTDTPTGREQVAQILFRCGAYKDLIQATLIRYDLPPSLLAVVFAESGCSPTIKSPVGAEGLWQFMPESGRAYHLHITEEVLDERHSPQKSTEAAVHFLADLYAKFGSWDLAFAAYNMGPYGLYARQQRAGGGDVGFWELLDADLLPGETSNYVPIIEAYALILENLQKLKFASVQMRSPEVTADLDAPPGTRLGLIARAASTSVNQIRALNLDLKADFIPTIPGQRFSIQVPHDNVWQARDQLDELIAQGSYDDQCVADNFDWGKQQFGKQQQDECRRRLGANAPAGRAPHTP